MKKFGYTLAEVLIALSIVGILSAVTLPLANKFKPDSNKAIFLNTYDSLVQILNEVSSNQNLYPITIINQNGQTWDFSRGPLYNTAQAEITDPNDSGTIIFTTQEGAPKLCSILAETFGQTNNSPNCQNIPAYSDVGFANNVSFTNNQGVDFSIYFDSEINQDANGNLTPTWQNQISIDVNGDKLPNCRYQAMTCKRPDRFTFIIAPNGHIEPADEMGQAYLETRENLRYAEYDMNEYDYINDFNEIKEGYWMQSSMPTQIQ